MGASALTPLPPPHPPWAGGCELSQARHGHAVLAQIASHMSVFSRALPPECLEFLAKGVSPRGLLQGWVMGWTDSAGGLGCSPGSGVGRANQDKDSHCPARQGHPGGAQSPPHFPPAVPVPEFLLVWGWVEGAQEQPHSWGTPQGRQPHS